MLKKSILPSLLVILAVVGYLFLKYHTSQDIEGAREVLVKNGYSHIEVKPENDIVCGIRNRYATGFEAINMNGKTVEGAVCQRRFFTISSIYLK